MTERIVKCKYGEFKFELVEYSGASPMVDVWFNAEHVGYLNYINLDEATDLDLLEATALFNDDE